MNVFKVSLWLLSGVLFFVGCSDESETDSDKDLFNVEWQMKSVSTILTADNSIFINPFERFQVNVSAVEFNFQTISDDQSAQLFLPETLTGPFLVDILSKELFSGKILGSAKVPKGHIGDVEIGFEPSQDNSFPDIKGAVILGKGIYNDKTTGKEMPFVIKSNEMGPIVLSLETEAASELVDKDLKLVVSIDIDHIISSLYSLSSSTAVEDRNGDGTIEINTDGTDGNEVLALSLVSALENSFSLSVVSGN